MTIPSKRRPTVAVLRAVVSTYRRLPRRRPPACRFEPTCSAFALEAIDLHGALRGSALTVRRLSRCHPWGGAGYDPVPLPAETASGGVA